MKLGKAFSDSLIIEEKREKRALRDESDSWWLGAGRALILATILTIAFFVLTWRLFALTVVDGRMYRLLADGNRTRELIRHAPRGMLLDRTGKPLVTNIVQYRLIRPCEGQGSACTVRLLQEEGELLEQKGLADGEFLEKDFRREYLYPQALAHVLGYTGEINEQELSDEYYSVRKYLSGDRVGRMGAEAYFEEQLRGRNGRELVEVDAAGKILRVLGRDPEASGEDVTLSVDARLASIAKDAFPAGFSGAVVVSKPTTGEILAIYSSPSYSPNAFSFGLSEGEYEQLINNPDMPLFNRAIGGAYPPGSTFKIVTAIAGLEEGTIKEHTTVEDVGVLRIGPFSFPNWYFMQYGKTDGVVDVVKALQRSNDIYFYKAAEWLGITKLVVWAKRLGIGAPLGIELAGEAGGLMPDPGWKAKQFDTSEDREARNDQWYLGDTYHVGIGQGYLLTTPLQVNAWTNVIANGGKLCKPTIKKQSKEHRAKGTECKDLGMKKETIELITEGMVAACETGGTGWPLFGFGVNVSTRQRIDEKNTDTLTPSDTSILAIPVACKTGTAEFGDLKNKTHAWFTAFAPVPKESRSDALLQGPTLQLEQQDALTGEPEISVTVLVEKGGEGSSVAAPIAKKILEEWFER